MGETHNARSQDRNGEERHCRFCPYRLQDSKALFVHRPVMVIVVVTACFLSVALTLWNVIGQGWWLPGLAVISLPLLFSSLWVMPTGTVTIVRDEGERHGQASAGGDPAGSLRIMVDGCDVACENDNLPKQVKIYFWRRALYTVLVVCGGQVFWGELNLYEDRSAATTITIAMPSGEDR